MKESAPVLTIVINTGVAILHHQEVKLALIWESFKMRITDLYESAINEDMGALPSMAELIVMAVVAQTSFAALKMMVKTAYKTGKGLNKIRKLAKAAGVALDAKINPDMYYDDEDEVMEDANSKMLDAAMKAIEHMIKQDGNKQSVSGYAYEVSRVFGGKPDARTLAAHYEKEKLNAS